MTSKILYIFDASDTHSRMVVAHTARDQGHEVVVGLIDGDAESMAAQDDNHGLKILPLSTQGGGGAMGAVSRLIRDIHRLVKREQPDTLHIVTLKYSALGAVSALPFQGVRKIFTMAGLGYVFRSPSFKAKVMQAVLRAPLTVLFRRPHTTLIFQNPDDLDLLVQGGYVKAAHTALIRGSGVDLEVFKPRPYANRDERQRPLVVMPTRLVHDKGIAVFVAAAQLLKAQGYDFRFQIAGGLTQHNPKAISRETMHDYVRDGTVQWLGRVSDMPALLAEADVVVFPSYYGEGIPRVLLEACAMGKPIVTTDHAGCREAVDHGKNGYLVPIKDADATAQAIAAVLDDRAAMDAMGMASRAKAEREFNLHDIAHRTAAVYDMSPYTIMSQ